MKIRKRLISLSLWLTFGALALFASRAYGQTPEQMMSMPIPMDPAVRYGKLDNGMTYYIRANAKPKDRAEFYILHHVGAILEEDDQNGLAHFTEHMAFNGTKNFPGKALLNFLEHNGVKFGADVNAFTTQDMTCYNISDVPTMRKGLLDSCVQVLCDWSGDILFDPAEIDAEREVIVEEWRTRRNAEWRMREAKMQVLYRGSKYAERDVIGPITLIRSFNHKSLTDFYHKWYRPEFQAIIIVGDFNVDEMEARVKRMGNKIPKRTDQLVKPSYPIPDADGVDLVTITDPEARMLRVELMYKLKPASQETKNIRSFQKDLVRTLAISMLSDRLNQLARSENKPFVAAGANHSSLTETCDLFFVAGVGQSGQLSKTLNGLITETQRARQKGFTSTELARAKANLKRQIQNQFDERNKQNNTYYINQYILNFTANEPIPPAELEMQLAELLLPAITVDETNESLNQLINQRNLVIAISGPESEKANMPSEQDVQNLFDKIYDSNLDPWVDNTKDEPLISQRPKAGRVTATRNNKKFETIEWKLSNGARVILKPTKFKDDEVLLRGEAPGGLSLVSTEDLPSAEVAGEIISYSGLGNFDMLDLEKALAGKNASISASLGNYSSSVYGSSSAKMDELETMFQLLYLQFTQPRFDEKGLNTLTDILNTVLTNQDKDPNFIFRKKLQNTLTNNSPRRAQFDLERVKKINLDRAAKAYSERFANAQNFTFIITGNIDPNQIKPLVETYIASLPQGIKEHWRDDGIRPFSRTLLEEFNQKMETPKSSAAIVFIGKGKYNLENIVATEALNHILDLRCTEEVREEHGGTYGVSTNVSITPRPKEWNTMLFAFDTEPEKLDGIIPIIEDIVRKLNHSISENDLQKAKKHLLKSYEEQIKTNRYWLYIINQYEQMGVDLHSDYEKDVKALTPNSLQKDAKQFFGNHSRLDLYMRGFK